MSGVLARCGVVRHVHDHVVLAERAGGDVQVLIGQQKPGDHGRALRRERVEVTHQATQDKPDVDSTAGKQRVAATQVGYLNGQVIQILDRVNHEVHRLILAGRGERLQRTTDLFRCRRACRIDLVFPGFAGDNTRRLGLELERIVVGGLLSPVHVEQGGLHRPGRGQHFFGILASRHSAGPNAVASPPRRVAALRRQHKLLHARDIDADRKRRLSAGARLRAEQLLAVAPYLEGA